MKNFKTDLAVIGGGPAGLAAAVRAKELGIKNVMLIERDVCLGGILQQCIHDGFGLHRFKKRMSGNQYAQSFIDEIEKTDIKVMLNTMVLELTPDKEIYACSEEDGMMKINCGAVILAMGCRERTASQVLLYGHRPAGVLTAGVVQRYINIEGYLPGKKAVILGSGDIGLIMARRMTLEGIKVEGVFEIMKSPGGLTRNVVQCLEDYDIPLETSTSVTWIHGKDKLEGVTVAKVDEDRNVIKGTERYIDCDLLVLAVGLIPENELSFNAGIEMDPMTKGPILDNHFMTSIPGIFAAGNVSVVYDLVDYVSIAGEIAAEGAFEYISDPKADFSCSKISFKGNINSGVPQRLRKNDKEIPVNFFMRVKEPKDKAVLEFYEKERFVGKKNFHNIDPPEMVSCKINLPGLDEISLFMKEA